VGGRERDHASSSLLSHHKTSPPAHTPRTYTSSTYTHIHARTHTTDIHIAHLHTYTHAHTHTRSTSTITTTYTHLPPALATARKTASTYARAHPHTDTEKDTDANTDTQTRRHADTHPRRHADTHLPPALARARKSVDVRAAASTCGPKQSGQRRRGASRAYSMPHTHTPASSSLCMAAHVYSRDIQHGRTRTLPAGDSVATTHTHTHTHTHGLLQVIACEFRRQTRDKEYIYIYIYIYGLLQVIACEFCGQTRIQAAHACPPLEAASHWYVRERPLQNVRESNHVLQ
jgi:hypothetical protein